MREWEPEAMRCYERGMFDTQIARVVGVCTTSINAWRRRLGLPKYPRRSAEGEARNTEMQKLRLEGWSLQAIADRFEISRERVRQICGNGGLACNRLDHLADDIISLFNDGLSPAEIASRLDVGLCALRQWLKQGDFEADSNRTMRHVVHPERTRLYRLGATDTEIAAAEGKSVGTITEWRHRRGLPRNPKLNGVQQ